MAYTGAEFILWNIKHIFALLSFHNTEIVQGFFQQEGKAYLPYRIKIIVADNLVIQGAKASTAIVSTFQNFSERIIRNDDKHKAHRFIQR